MPRVVIALFLVAMGNPARAEWSQLHRSQYTNDCMQSCTANPKVHQSRQGECPAYCSCIVSEAEKFISDADYSRLETTVSSGGRDPNLDRLRALYPICNTRVFGPQQP